MEPNPEITDKTPQSLPFRYQRVTDPKIAQFKEWRIYRIKEAGKENQPRTDEEILAHIQKEREEKDWFTSEYWRMKEQPLEQVEFEIEGHQPVTLYNWNPEKPFNDARLEKTLHALQELSSHFPQALTKLRWILVDNIDVPSAFGDSAKYPYNGHSYRSWSAFRFLPKGTELTPHRISKTSNIEGTLVHETSHPIEDEFSKEWGEYYQWEFCIDHKDEWETRYPPEGDEKRWFNKKTGVMAPQHQFPLQPEECVTEYAKLSREEDICDSITAYFYDPELLKKISPRKYQIISSHDAQSSRKLISARKVPKDEIKLPEIKPETVNYYIREPETVK